MFFLSLSSRHGTGCRIRETEWFEKENKISSNKIAFVFCVTDQGYSIDLLLRVFSWIMGEI